MMTTPEEVSRWKRERRRVWVETKYDYFGNLLRFAIYLLCGLIFALAAPMWLWVSAALVVSLVAALGLGVYLRRHQKVRELLQTVKDRNPEFRTFLIANVVLTTALVACFNVEKDVAPSWYATTWFYVLVAVAVAAVVVAVRNLSKTHYVKAAKDGYSGMFTGYMMAGLIAQALFLGGGGLALTHWVTKGDMQEAVRTEGFNTKTAAYERQLLAQIEADAARDPGADPFGDRRKDARARLERAEGRLPGAVHSGSLLANIGWTLLLAPCLLLLTHLMWPTFLVIFNSSTAPYVDLNDYLRAYLKDTVGVSPSFENVIAAQREGIASGRLESRFKMLAGWHGLNKELAWELAVTQQREMVVGLAGLLCKLFFMAPLLCLTMPFVAAKRATQEQREKDMPTADPMQSARIKK